MIVALYIFTHTNTEGYNLKVNQIILYQNTSNNFSSLERCEILLDKLQVI